jgi:hypothetical protein
MGDIEQKQALLISYIYYPSTAVGARRIYHIKKYLKKSGIIVTILTTNERKYAAIDNDLDTDESRENVHRTTAIGPIIIPSKRTNETIMFGLIRRCKYILQEILRTFLFPDEHIGWLPFAVYKAIRLHKKYKYAYVIASGCPWTNFVVADIVQKVCKIPLVLDYRDPWTVLDDNYYGSKSLLTISKWYETGLLKRAHTVIVNTQTSRELFLTKYADSISGFADKIHVVYNGFNYEVYNDLKSTDKTIPLKFRMVHTGNFCSGRKLTNLLKAIRNLRNETLISSSNFEFVTYGPLQSGDAQLKRVYGIEDLIVEEDFIPYYSSLKQLRNSTINFMIIGEEHVPMIPAKFFDYLMVERPIFVIGPSESEVKNIIQAFNYGSFCNINDCDDIEANLKMLLQKYLLHQLRDDVHAPISMTAETQIDYLGKILHSI